MDKITGWLWVEYFFVKRKRVKIVNKKEKFSKVKVWKIREGLENNG